MMKLLILNGPNINMLGYRQKDIYGQLDYEGLNEYIMNHDVAKGHDISIVQSNIEGELVSIIQSLIDADFDGLIFNPAAYSHYSIAILDALLLLDIPIVEVHLSDVYNREDFRKVLLTSRACDITYSGEHEQGYIKAISYLVENKH